MILKDGLEKFLEEASALFLAIVVTFVAFEGRQLCLLFAVARARLALELACSFPERVLSSDSKLASDRVGDSASEMGFASVTVPVVTPGRGGKSVVAWGEEGEVGLGIGKDFLDRGGDVDKVGKLVERQSRSVLVVRVLEGPVEDLANRPLGEVQRLVVIVPRRGLFLDLLLGDLDRIDDVQRAVNHVIKAVLDLLPCVGREILEPVFGLLRRRFGVRPYGVRGGCGAVGGGPYNIDNAGSSALDLLPSLERERLDVFGLAEDGLVASVIARGRDRQAPTGGDERRQSQQRLLQHCPIL